MRAAGEAAMNWLMQTIYLCLAVIVYEAPAVKAVDWRSDCGEEHYQAKFCRAEFVLKAQLRRPSADQPFADWISMDIKIKNEIKINDQFERIDDAGLERLLIAPAAYEKVHNKTKYIVSGNVLKLNGQLRLAAADCDWLQPWADLTHRVKAALRKRKYADNCQCAITVDGESERHDQCSTTAGLSANSTSGSQLFAANDGRALNECYRRHAHCRALNGRQGRHTAAHCKWSSNGELDACLQCVAAGNAECS